MFENIRSFFICNLQALLPQHHHILLFLLIKGHRPHHVWFFNEYVAHVSGQLVYFLSVLALLLLHRSVYSLAVEVFILISFLQLLYLLYVIHHPVPITLLLLTLGLALTLNPFGTLHMAQTVKLELHFYGEWFFYGFIALDFIALEDHDNLLNIQFKVRVEEVCMIVDSCQLLRPTPCILKYLNEDVSHQWLLYQLRMLTEVELGQKIIIISCLFDAQEVLVMQSYLVDCDQSITDHLPPDFWHFHQFLKIQEVPGLAGLVDSVLLTAEPLTIVEGQRICRFFIESHIEHKPNDGSSGPSLSMIAMHSHNSRPILCIKKHLTFQVLFDLMRDLHQSSDGWSLMISPLVFPHSPSKLTVIIRSAADIDDEVVILMIFVEITSDVIDGIAISFFEEVGSRVCHSDYSIRYVGQVQLLTIEGGFLLGAGHQLADHRFHLDNIITSNGMEISMGLGLCFTPKKRVSLF